MWLGATILLCIAQVTAQAPRIEWQRKVDHPFDDWARDVLNLGAENGYLVVGMTTVIDAPTEDVYVALLKADGEIAWERRFGGPFTDSGNSVAMADDGGFVVVGYANGQFGGCSPEICSQRYVFRISRTGDLEWERVFPDKGSNVARMVKRTADRGYVIAGDAAPDPISPRQAFLFRIDGFGNELWTKFIPTLIGAKGYSVEQTSDGGYVLSGEGEPVLDRGRTAAFVVRTDADGNITWETSFGKSSFSTAMWVKEQPDGTFFAIGATRVVGGTTTDIYLVRLDSDGKVIWENVIERAGHEDVFSAKQLADRGFIIIGSTGGEGVSSGPYLLRVDEHGARLWDTVLASKGLETLVAIDLTDDSGYILCGTGKPVRPSVYQGSDVYVVKLSSESKIDRPFLRGDSNTDGQLDILDSVFNLWYLFVGTAAPDCLDAVDANDDGEISISDPIYLLNYLFAGGPAPPEPYPESANDPTIDSLSC